MATYGPISGRIDIKIHKQVLDKILRGEGPGNRLDEAMKRPARAIVDAAQSNTRDAPNRQPPQGHRRSRTSGAPGRVDTGSLMNSYTYTTITTSKGLEVRVGSTSPIAIFHEEGTYDKGGEKGILPGHMLKDAAESVVGRYTPIRIGKF